MPRFKPRSLLRRSTKAAPSSGGFAYGGGPLWSDAYRSRRGPTSYELVEAHKSCLFFLSKFNSKAVASTPLRLMITTRGGQSKPKSYLGTRPVSRWKKAWLKDRHSSNKAVAGAEDIEEVTGEHPILEALRTVNPFLDINQLIALTITSVDIIGQAYWEPTIRNVGGVGVPQEIWMLPAQVIWPIPEGTSLVPAGFQYFSKRYEIEELIRFYDPGLRNMYMDGNANARSAIEYARLEDEFVTVQDSVWSGGPRPNIVLSPKDSTLTFGTPERTRLRNEFNAIAARGRMGGLVITDGAVDVKPITFAPMDPGALAVAEYNLERMANALDIPPPFYSKETNLANMQAAREQHAKYGVEPRCKRTEATLTRWFRAHDGNGRLGWERLFFAFDPVVEEDKKAASELHKTYIDMGVITRDEVRADLGHEPYPDGLGEVPIVQGSLKTLDAVVNPPEPPPMGNAPGLPVGKPKPGEKIPAKAEESNPEPEPTGEGKKGLPFDGGRPTRFEAKDADRGADDHRFPGDERDPHEANTFHLPNGNPIRRSLKRWFRRIAREVLGTLPTIGAPIPRDWPRVVDYEDPMASAMTPMLAAYWDEAGKLTRSRLGLDPDEWRVVDPHVHDMIVTQAHDFCQSTLQTTADSVRDAYDKLNTELIAGVVTEGEAYPELTKRVRSVFTDLSKSGATRIARTETARAVNGASLQSAKESGVVSAKRWLLSASACPHCQAVAQDVNGRGGIPLDEPFATGLSDKEAYATCQSPPLHPSCRCSLTFSLVDKYQSVVDETPDAVFVGAMGVSDAS